MITKQHLAGFALIALTIAGVGAQSAPQTAERPKSPAVAGARVVPPEPPGQPTNIKLDLTITDQTGPGDPLRKVVTMVVADRRNGSIRSQGSVRTQGRVQINADVQPTILQSGAIRLRLGLEYNPRNMTTDAPTEWSSLNEQITVIVDPGKPLVISQAADPASDRKITVEIRAALLK